MITSISRLISADLTRLLPIAFVLIAFVLFLGFRTFERSNSALTYSYNFNYLGYWHYGPYGIRNDYGFEQYSNCFAGCGNSLFNPCAEQDRQC